MTDPTLQSQRLVAYARTFGEPDAETSARLRQHLYGYVEARELGRRRWIHWLQAAAFTAVGLVGASVWALHAREEPAAPSTPHSIATDDSAQRIELPDGRTATLAPSTEIRLVRDDSDQLVIELLRGEVELDVAADGLPVVIDSGDHRVLLQRAAARVRHTGGVPLVVVREGAAEVYGPGLPPGGVHITPIDGSSTQPW